MKLAWLSRFRLHGLAWGWLAGCPAGTPEMWCVLGETGATCGEFFFWGVHAGAELDLLILKDGCRLGFEVKLTKSPSVSASMRSAKETLGLDLLFVMCHAEGVPWALAQGIAAMPATCIAQSQWMDIVANIKG